MKYDPKSFLIFFSYFSFLSEETFSVLLECTRSGREEEKGVATSILETLASRTGICLQHNIDLQVPRVSWKRILQLPVYLGIDKVFINSVYWKILQLPMYSGIDIVFINSEYWKILQLPVYSGIDIVFINSVYWKILQLPVYSVIDIVFINSVYWKILQLPVYSEG